MYLLDTNVVSEFRKGRRANVGVANFLATVNREHIPTFISAISVGELKRGAEQVRRRGDSAQASRLTAWLDKVLASHYAKVLPFDTEAGVVWGSLCAIDPSHAIDKQVAAIALLHDLTVVTRNTADFARTGVRLLNPFADRR